MTKEQLKSVSALLFLSGISTGFIQAAPHVDAMGVQSVQQNNACTGIVVDQNGETIIGASVVVKGTTNGTITGLDGDFSISNVKKAISSVFLMLDTLHKKSYGMVNRSKLP